ncbi:hypothetical protein Tco_0170049 [Tanacetum coccineum]
MKQKVYWCESIVARKGKSYELWPSCDPYHDECDEGDLNDMSRKDNDRNVWTSMNDDERTEDLRDDSHEKGYADTDDDNDLDRLEDYLEFLPNDGFIDIDDEAYKERMCTLLGMTYKKPQPIKIKKFEITRYMIEQEKRYVKVNVVEIDEIPRTISYGARIKAELMEEMDAEGYLERAT